MSYEMLVKEAVALKYEEQISLMAALANSINTKTRITNNTKNKSQRMQEQLDALNTLAGMFTEEDVKNVNESIAAGINF